MANALASRLKALGGKVELIEPGPDTFRMPDAPEQIGKMVSATFSGTGTKRILLLAHMDNVYPRGWLAKQPFKIEGDRAWGLGIADAKHGIAVILHSLAILKALNFRDYGTVTVLINGDEEIGSPASRNTITRLGAEHDAVMSFENGGYKLDRVALGTSGVATGMLTVRGRAAQSFIPERGVNALYELAHQILQTRTLSNPAVGLQVNWTMANAGVVRTMIPPEAKAQADIRVRRVSDYDGIEQRLREVIGNRLLSEAQVELEFERRRPPLEATDASRALAAHAQQIYREIGKQLSIRDLPGGTDAAYAALKTIAITGESRAPTLPNVATFKEQSMPGMDVKLWYGILAPVATPRETVDKYAAEIARILALPDTKEKFAVLGMDPWITTPEQFAATMRADTAKYAKIIKTANISIDK